MGRKRRGFVGIVLFFALVPGILQITGIEYAHQRFAAQAARDFAESMRARFFEANLRRSFLIVLASAKGESPGEIVIDLLPKIARWSAAAAQAASARGYGISFWACKQLDGQATCENGADKMPFFFNSSNADLWTMFRLYPESSEVSVEYQGNSTMLGDRAGSHYGMGLTFFRAGYSYDVTFPEGLYAATNRANSTGPGFGFRQ